MTDQGSPVTPRTDEWSDLLTRWPNWTEDDWREKRNVAVPYGRLERLIGLAREDAAAVTGPQGLVASPATSVAGAPGLREALAAWMAEPSDHVHPVTPAEERLMKIARSLAAAPDTAADARLRDLLSRCQNAVELNAVHSGSTEARALAAELRGVLFPATADTPEATR